jgi:hypothetical protein
MMKRVRISQVAPLRLGITLGLICGFVGLVVTPIMLITLGAAATAANTSYAPRLLGVPWLFFGAGAIFMPFIYALAGFALGVVLAMVYNLASRWTGGIEFIFDDSN